MTHSILTIDPQSSDDPVRQLTGEVEEWVYLILKAVAKHDGDGSKVVEVTEAIRERQWIIKTGTTAAVRTVLHGAGAKEAVDAVVFAINSLADAATACELRAVIRPIAALQNALDMLYTFARRPSRCPETRKRPE